MDQVVKHAKCSPQRDGTNITHDSINQVALCRGSSWSLVGCQVVRNHVASCCLDWLRAMGIRAHVPNSATSCEGQGEGQAKDAILELK